MKTGSPRPVGTSLPLPQAPSPACASWVEPAGHRAMPGMSLHWSASLHVSGGKTVAALSSPLLGYTALTLLILWRVFSRFKRAIGPQRLSRYRAPLTFAIYGPLLLAVIWALAPRPLLIAELLGFMAAGAALAAVALRRTLFEAKPGLLSYTPYKPIALGLATLFLARLAYRLVEVFWLAPEVHRSAREFVSSPLTLGALGLFAGYTLWYTKGLAAWRRNVIATRRARESLHS